MTLTASLSVAKRSQLKISLKGPTSTHYRSISVLFTTGKWGKVKSLKVAPLDHLHPEITVMDWLEVLSTRESHSHVGADVLWLNFWHHRQTFWIKSIQGSSCLKSMPLHSRFQSSNLPPRSIHPRMIKILTFLQPNQFTNAFTASVKIITNLNNHPQSTSITMQPINRTVPLSLKFYSHLNP